MTITIDSSALATLTDLASLTGTPLTAALAVGLVGPGRGSLLAWYQCRPHPVANLAPLRHALALERDYAELVASFDAVAAPRYGGPVLDVQPLAARFGVDRVLCLLVQEARGAVRGGRDYDDVDVRTLDDLLARFDRLRLQIGAPAGYGRG